MLLGTLQGEGIGIYFFLFLVEVDGEFGDVEYGGGVRERRRRKQITAAGAAATTGGAVV